MSAELIPFDNCYQPAYQARGTTVNAWGKDSTGLIKYTFNNQGFRSDVDYNWVPEYAFFGNSSVFGVGVNNDQSLCSNFNRAQNYGISGRYLNQHSVTNLENFIKSSYYRPDVKIVFFWIGRPSEDIESMIEYVNTLHKGIINIMSGKKRKGGINLMPHIDQDISQTHPGPKTYQIWAKTIKLLFTHA